MLTRKLLTMLINQTLALDPKTTPLIKKLVGTIIKINIDRQKTALTFWIDFKETGISFIPPSDLSPHVCISGPLKAFLSLAIHKNPLAAMRLDLSIEGNAEVLEMIQTLFFSLEIDWEEYLSYWTGDIIAYQIGNWGRLLKKRRRSIFQSTKESITEYLTEELKVLPARPEANEFLEDVDKLRADIERLSLKVQRIHERECP